MQGSKKGVTLIWNGTVNLMLIASSIIVITCTRKLQR